jgi:hypothetical protein
MYSNQVAGNKIYLDIIIPGLLLICSQLQLRRRSTVNGKYLTVLNWPCMLILAGATL